MNPPETKSVKQIAKALGASPLFNLSLTSKELFHSNFLYWLCETNKEAAGKLFSAYLPNTHESCKIKEAEREKEHINLWIEFTDKSQLIIENKVKSMPLKPQLEAYAEKHAKSPNTGFLLLSLERPSFLPAGENKVTMSNGVVWQCLGYGELAGELRKMLPEVKQGYDAALLADYCNFIENLSALQQKCSVNWESESGDFFEIGDDRDHLQEIRLHDLFDKLRYSGLAQRVTEKLGGVFNPCHDFKLIQEREVFITSGMTRGTGLFDFKYCLCGSGKYGKPVILGVQLQGNDFRLVVEMENSAEAERIAQRLLKPKDGKRIWFDFGAVPGDSQEYPHKEGKDFNQYSKQFFYRSKRLKGISPSKLVDTIVAYALLARDETPSMLRQAGLSE